MPIGLKEHVYDMEVGPSLQYGTECWATNEKEQEEIQTAGMCILIIVCAAI